MEFNEKVRLVAGGLKVDEPFTDFEMMQLCRQLRGAKYSLDIAEQKLAAMESQKPLCVVENKSLAKLADGKEAKVYGCSPHMLYNPDYHSNLYAKPVPADKPAVAAPEHIEALIDKVRHWGVEHTGCEPSVSCFHRALDELVEAVESRLGVVVPDGWKLVPEDLDFYDDIVDAACDAGNLYRVDFVRAWEAALLKAPSHSQQSSRITEQDAREICDSYWEFCIGHVVAKDAAVRVGQWIAHGGSELLAKLNTQRCPSHESEQGANNG